MNVLIGRKIRELRKARGISQEVLAQYIGVSFQAVSKWENDIAMPDVALIPALASFFDVSTDELFDYNRLEAEQKVQDLCGAAADLRDESPQKAEAMLREGLKQFPGNDIILNNLLYTIRSPERYDEVVSICKTLIVGTKDDEVRFDALRILAETYHEMGQQDLVSPTLEQLPELYFTKLECMAENLEGDVSLDAAHRQFGLNIDSTVEMLLIMRDRLREKGEDGDAAKWERIAKGVIQVLQREDGERFASANFYRYCRETLEKLS